MSDKKIKAVLWDMDGTLFNTKRGIELAIRDAVKDVGLPAPVGNEVDRFIGPPIQYTFKEFYGLSEEKAKEVAGYFRTYYREKGYVLESDIYPGLLDIITKLKEEGCLMAVCTLKKQDMAERIVEHNGLKPIFDSVIGTDAIDSIKKHDTIRMTCEKFGIKEENAVLIGDTDYDALGAEKAGCLFIGVTYGFGFKGKEDIDPYPNIGTASSAEDILKLISDYDG